MVRLSFNAAGLQLSLESGRCGAIAFASGWLQTVQDGIRNKKSRSLFASRLL